MDGGTLLVLLAEVQGRSPRCDSSYAVKPLPEAGVGWIGRSRTSHAAFLLRAKPQMQRPHGLQTSFVTVRHGVRVVVDDGLQEVEADVSLIECSAADRPMIEVFVRCIGSVLMQQTGPLSGEALAQAMERLLELFRDLSHATDAEILGLWSELALIAHSSNPARMLEYWRLHGASRYDFGTPTERLDVKATTNSQRHHELSYDQVRPPTGATAALASMMTERVSSGVSVGQLWDQVLQAAPALQYKVDIACVTTLGRDWQVAREHSFDLQRALASLLVYPSGGVPTLMSLPPGVLRARFVSDFDKGAAWKGSPPSPDGPIALAIDCSIRYIGSPR